MLALAIGFSAAILYASSATAHMAMVKPCARYTPAEGCPAPPPGQQLDYSLSSPMERTAPLCKHTVPYESPVENWTEGQQISVEFDKNGGAAHGGGHCQFSLSYDCGKTFVVIHEELRYCFVQGPDGTNTPVVRDYEFNLPQGLPSSDHVVFAWSWVNAMGNREFYMNCADVSIKGSADSFTGKEMLIANMDGYPDIPEFGGNYDTGLDLYNKSATITVKPGNESCDTDEASSYVSNEDQQEHTDESGQASQANDSSSDSSSAVVNQEQQ